MRNGFHDYLNNSDELPTFEQAMKAKLDTREIDALNSAVIKLESAKMGLMSGLGSMGNIISGYALNEEYGINSDDIFALGYFLSVTSDVLIAIDQRIDTHIETIEASQRHK